MPTVVANADNKINALPNMTENTKAAPVEAAQKVPEVVEPPKTGKLLFFFDYKKL